jgi:hypothetical protein
MELLQPPNVAGGTEKDAFLVFNGSLLSSVCLHVSKDANVVYQQQCVVQCVYILTRTSSASEFPAEQLAVFETCMQQFCSYAVSTDVPQANKIEAAETVQSADGTTFTTDPKLAQYIRSTGAALSAGIHTAGGYVSQGIVQAGEWYRYELHTMFTSCICAFLL